MAGELYFHNWHESSDITERDDFIREESNADKQTVMRDSRYIILPKYYNYFIGGAQDAKIHEGFGLRRDAPVSCEFAWHCTNNTNDLWYSTALGIIFQLCGAPYNAEIAMPWVWIQFCNNPATPSSIKANWVVPGLSGKIRDQKFESAHFDYTTDRCFAFKFWVDPSNGDFKLYYRHSGNVSTWYKAVDTDDALYTENAETETEDHCQRADFALLVGTSFFAVDTGWLNDPNVDWAPTDSYADPNAPGKHRLDVSYLRLGIEPSGSVAAGAIPESYLKYERKFAEEGALSIAFPTVGVPYPDYTVQARNYIDVSGNATIGELGESSEASCHIDCAVFGSCCVDDHFNAGEEPCEFEEVVSGLHSHPLFFYELTYTMGPRFAADMFVDTGLSEPNPLRR